ncbi:hypothetical protein A8B98_19145 [Hymenobacter sp. UV11]|nr:hypothetical protein A8B98_19145 [Hymenobacter sp. UV11]
MHHFVRPVEITIWQLAPLGGDSAAAYSLQRRLATEPGVSACAVSPRTSCVAFVYHPEQTTLAALYQAVGHYGARIIDNPPANTAQSAIRQCPVPVSYLAWLDQVRFALNVRRFFVSV